MNITENIRQFVIDNFLFGDDPGFSNRSSLIQEGIIDSTGILELVTFLEKGYGIEIADRELVPENLDSIDRAAAFVQRKLSAGAGLPTGYSSDLKEAGHGPRERRAHAGS